MNNYENNDEFSLDGKAEEIVQSVPVESKEQNIKLPMDIDVFYDTFIKGNERDKSFFLDVFKTKAECYKAVGLGILENPGEKDKSRIKELEKLYLDEAEKNWGRTKGDQIPLFQEAVGTLCGLFSGSEKAYNIKLREPLVNYQQTQLKAAVQSKVDDKLLDSSEMVSLLTQAKEYGLCNTESETENTINFIKDTAIAFGAKINSFEDDFIDRIREMSSEELISSDKNRNKLLDLYKEFKKNDISKKAGNDADLMKDMEKCLSENKIVLFDKTDLLNAYIKEKGINNSGTLSTEEYFKLKITATEKYNFTQAEFEKFLKEKNLSEEKKETVETKVKPEQNEFKKQKTKKPAGKIIVLLVVLLVLGAGVFTLLKPILQLNLLNETSVILKDVDNVNRKALENIEKINQEALERVEKVNREALANIEKIEKEKGDTSEKTTENKTIVQTENVKTEKKVEPQKTETKKTESKKEIKSEKKADVKTEVKTETKKEVVETSKAVENTSLYLSEVKDSSYQGIKVKIHNPPKDAFVRYVYVNNELRGKSGYSVSRSGKNEIEPFVFAEEWGFPYTTSGRNYIVQIEYLDKDYQPIHTTDPVLIKAASGLGEITVVKKPEYDVFAGEIEFENDPEILVGTKKWNSFYSNQDAFFALELMTESGEYQGWYYLGKELETFNLQENVNSNVQANTPLKFELYAQEKDTKYGYYRIPVYTYEETSGIKMGVSVYLSGSTFDVDISDVVENYLSLSENYPWVGDTQDFEADITNYQCILDITSEFSRYDWPEKGDIIHLTWKCRPNKNARKIYARLVENTAAVGWWKEMDKTFEKNTEDCIIVENVTANKAMELDFKRELTAEPVEGLSICIWVNTEDASGSIGLSTVR